MTVNGPHITGKAGQINMINQCVMSSGLEVLGTITAGGLSVLTTGTGYTKALTLSTVETTSLLDTLHAYTSTKLGLKSDITSIYTQTQANALLDAR